MNTVRSAHNLSAGPGALPATVLAEASRGVLRFESTGDSILGLSHRSPRFREIIDDAAAGILALLGAPPGYRVLFLQGGASLQFSTIAMHLLQGSSRSADYITCGYWSTKAAREAAYHGDVRILWSGESAGFTRTPECEELTPTPAAAYLHYVSNETVEGLQFPYVPGRDTVPRVCDMSSDFLSRPIALSRFDLIYAHAQKNLGPAGVTIVVLRDWILERGAHLPSVLRYSTHAEHGSIFNTPPVFAIYVTWLVTRWLLDEIGGLEAMQAINHAKAARLYATLDRYPHVFEPSVAKASRSTMNVTFRLRERHLEPDLVRAAAQAGFLGIEGHRSVGGLRISLYNAVTPASVEAFCGFLEEFVHARGR